MTVNMITKSKITINSIVEFVHKAMNNNCDISVNEFPLIKLNSTGSGNHLEFNIRYDDIEITFIISNDAISICGYDKGYVRVSNQLSERDKIDLDTLKLDVEEYNEDKAINLFNDFFSTIPPVPASIDNLDDDD